MTRTRNIITHIGKKGCVIIDHPVAVGGGGGERKGGGQRVLFFP